MKILDLEEENLNKDEVNTRQIQLISMVFTIHNVFDIYYVYCRNLLGYLKKRKKSLKKFLVTMKTALQKLNLNCMN